MTRSNYSRIDFISAVRRGMSSVVRHHLQGDFSQSFFDEDDNRVYPFDEALKHDRWKVALDILERRHVNDNLLLPGITFYEEEIEKSQIDAGPLEAGTPLKRAINDLLLRLSLRRNHRPLPKPLRDRMLPFLDLLVIEDGLDNTLLRVLSLQPKWLDWSERLLNDGASPNALMVHQFSGVTVNALELAGRNGLEKEVNELLKHGADPYYKHHNFDLTVHRVARIEKWPSPLARQAGWDFYPINESLELLLSRRRCLERLLEIEGMGETRGIDGKEPLTVWKEELDLLQHGFLRKIEESKEREQPHLMEKMMDLLVDKPPTQKPYSSAPSQKMRL